MLLRSRAMPQHSYLHVCTHVIPQLILKYQPAIIMRWCMRHVWANDTESSPWCAFRLMKPRCQHLSFVGPPVGGHSDISTSASQRVSDNRIVACGRAQLKGLLIILIHAVYQSIV